jgi:uncharacterized protein YbaR (Trm112 family)
MKIDTLDILRCPYCGGPLETVTSLFHRLSQDGRELLEGILGCQCCTFPVVAGIPILHLRPQVTAARDQLRDGRPDLAIRTMVGLADEGQAARFEAVVSSDAATYRDVVEALGENFEGGYFLYRFSDPSYIVAHALVRAVAGRVLADGGRAIDLCGGSGHLTRALMDLSSPAPVLADVYFTKVWLAQRFTAPGCESVCCDGNGPAPFARGAFRYAMCADAFMFIWTKRQFVQEMLRLIDGDTGPGAVVISHTHNALQWSPSHGQTLSPAGYRDLFETLEPRLFSEAGLFDDVVKGGPLDLSRRDSTEVLDRDPALIIVASQHDEVFRPHEIDRRPGAPGELRLNPAYVAGSDDDSMRLRLHFPDAGYADEFGACRQYLPEEVVISKTALAALADGPLPLELADLARRRVILDLPKRYY